MFFMRCNILCFAFFNILVQIQSFREPFAEEDYGIVVTEWVIRNIVNNLFSTLKLGDVRQKPKLQQYSKIHKFFVSISLQDHDNLKEITRLTKVDNIGNSIEVFIAQLNEVLNEDNKSDEATDAVYITTHIEEFRNRLENLKEIYGLKSNLSYFGINKEVIKYLSSNENDFGNATTIKTGNSTSDHLLSDNEFWQPSARRIYEGKRVDIKRFPFMASVQFFKKFQCGGSIIKSDLVITSASCLQLAWNNRFFRENPAFLSVQVGSNFFEIADENIPILEIYFHPNYNPKNLKHNLALLRLMRRLHLGAHNTKVKKINFDRNAWPLADDTDAITIVGWGARGSSNILESTYKNQLSYAVLDFYPLIECREVYSKEFVTERHFCAGFFSKGGGACNRDAGGPGVVGGVLMGVISFGSPNCGSPDTPTVFTKLGFYANWIEGIMSQNVASVEKQTTLKPDKMSTFTVSQTKIRTTNYHITPVNDEEMSDLLTPLPNQDLNELRTLDQNSLFKEFLKTMFDSNEIIEYLEQVQDETKEAVYTTKSFARTNTKTKLKSTSKTKLKPKPKPRMKLKSKLKPKAKNKRKINLRQKAKTKSKTKSQTKSKRKATSKTTPKTPKATAMEMTQNYKILTVLKPSYQLTTKSIKKQKSMKKKLVSKDEKELEELIVNLIDNLNVNELLKSKTPATRKNKKRVIKYESEDSSASESEESTTAQSIIDEPIRSLLDISDISEHEKRDISKEKSTGDISYNNENNADINDSYNVTGARKDSSNGKDETDKEDKNYNADKTDKEDKNNSMDEIDEEDKNIETDKEDEDNNNKDYTDIEENYNNDKGESNTGKESKIDKGHLRQGINDESNVDNLKDESNYEGGSYENQNKQKYFSNESDYTDKKGSMDNDSNNKGSSEHDSGENYSNDVVSNNDESSEASDSHDDGSSSKQNYEDDDKDNEAMSIEVNNKLISNKTDKNMDLTDSEGFYELISEAL